MNESLREPLRHCAWATHRLLAFCRDLSDEQLAATAPGAYGSLLATLQHTVVAEGVFRAVLTGAFPTWDWTPDESPGLDVLELRAADNARFWEAFIEEPFDPDRPCIQQGPQGRGREASAGVVVAQVIEHACEHRSQACSIITAEGLEPPDLQAWAYAYDVGLARDLPAT
jgi:uncharacterized damage-inducible protein DinB